MVEDLRAAGGESAGTVRFVAADLSDLACVRELVEDAGAVDILINNASVMTFSPTTGQDLASYDAAFAVNVRAPFLLTALGGGGSIVNVSSTAAGLGMPGMAVYGATKAALESLTRTWAAEFAESNVRVNAVAPGPMRTSKVVAAMGPDMGGMGLATAGTVAAFGRVPSCLHLMPTPPDRPATSRVEGDASQADQAEQPPDLGDGQGREPPRSRLAVLPSSSLIDPLWDQFQAPYGRPNPAGLPPQPYQRPDRVRQAGDGK